MQNLTRLYRKFITSWFRTQSPDKKPDKFTSIERLIIFMVSILIAVVSSHKTLVNSPINLSLILNWLITSVEIIICCFVLIIVSKKENPMINLRQIMLLLFFLLFVQTLKFNSGLSALAIIVPPSLIISQGLGTITALTWVAVATINWPDTFSHLNIHLFLITILSSFIVAMLGGKLRNRAQLLQLAIFVPLGTFIGEWILVGNNSIFISPDKTLSIEEIYSNSLFLIILLLISILLIPIFESIFGLLTKARLLELADQEKPLLRRLSIEAPGTFEHTLLICGLAEEATRTIGGDVDLIKTGGLYHDIGKLHAPNWFIENQTGGKNPHEELDDPIKSCEVLQNHVDEGLKIAQNNRLPKPIANFIPEHQGTLRMGYFLAKAKEKKMNISENKFRYKGPIPQSKETAILMLADGCEAALRAMNVNATELEASKTISGIIASRVRDGQLQDSNLSKAEIYLIKKSFLNVWKRIRHRRIQYPTSKNNTFS